MAETLQDILMARHCPNFQPKAMPLARAETPQVLEAEYTPINSAIAPMPLQQTEFAALAQKMDAQNKFVADGFSHLVAQGQSFNDRLTQLEQQRQPAPIAQYQQPQADITPALLAIAQIAQRSEQQSLDTQLAINNMTAIMQKMSDRPTVINHSTHNETRNVVIHGNNYGNIANGDQKNGAGFFVYIICVVATIIIGVQIYGK